VRGSLVKTEELQLDAQTRRDGPLVAPSHSYYHVILRRSVVPWNLEGQKGGTTLFKCLAA